MKTTIINSESVFEDIATIYEAIENNEPKYEILDMLASLQAYVKDGEMTNYFDEMIKEEIEYQFSDGEFSEVETSRKQIEEIKENIINYYNFDYLFDEINPTIINAIRGEME